MIYSYFFINKKTQFLQEYYQWARTKKQADKLVEKNCSVFWLPDWELAYTNEMKTLRFIFALFFKRRMKV